jgi:hypothetical protein
MSPEYFLDVHRFFPGLEFEVSFADGGVEVSVGAVAVDGDGAF